MGDRSRNGSRPILPHGEFWDILELVRKKGSQGPQNLPLYSHPQRGKTIGRRSSSSSPKLMERYPLIDEVRGHRLGLGGPHPGGRRFLRRRHPTGAKEHPSPRSADKRGKGENHLEGHLSA